MRSKTRCYDPTLHKREGPGHRGEYKGREHVCVGHVCVKPARKDRSQAAKSSFRGSMDMGGGFLVFSFFSVVCVLVKFVKLIKFVVH